MKTLSWIRSLRNRRTDSPAWKRHGQRLHVEWLEERALLTAPVQVFLLIGQSSMDGFGSNIAELRPPYDAPQADVWIWQDDLGQNVGWTSLRGGFGSDSNKGSGGNGSKFGPEVSLGRAVADARPDSQFALIKHVQAGTAATMQDGWNPDRGGGAGPGQIWSDFVAKAHEALDALTASQLDYQVAGLFVHQGNRDVGSETGVEAANYEQNFTHFLSGVRQEFGVPELPVVFTQVPDTPEGSSNHDGWVMVRNAQAAVDAADPLATMVQADDLSRFDEAHLDADGEIALGRRYANAYLGLPYEGAAKAVTDSFETGNFTGGSHQWSTGAWAVAGDASVSTASPLSPYGTHQALLRNSTGELTRSADVTGLTNLKLRFWSRLESFESGDKSWVKVSGDGVNWATLREFIDGEDDNVYRFHEIDVPNLGDTIYVRFDAQMNQAADYWYIDKVQLTGTTNGLPPADLPNKFYVVDDAAANRNYEYGGTGSWVDDYSLAVGNSAPRGAASTAAGTRVWVVDQNRNVYVYDRDGVLQGLWGAGSLPTNAVVEGIATNGTDIWLVDANSDKVYRYTGAASRLSGSQNAASSFSLNNGNKNPKDVVTDGASLWMVDDGTTDKVFKYTLAGALRGSWALTAGGGSPTGITLDPAAPGHLWVVDSGTDRVYQYDNAAGRTSGSQAASASFALAAGNTNPQGIADPPPPGMPSLPVLPAVVLKPPPTPAIQTSVLGGVPIAAAPSSLADRDAVFATLARQSLRTSGEPWINLMAAAPLSRQLDISPSVVGVVPGGYGRVDKLMPLARETSQRSRSEIATDAPWEGALVEKESQPSAVETDLFSARRADDEPVEV